MSEHTWHMMNNSNQDHGLMNTFSKAYRDTGADDENVKVYHDRQNHRFYFSPAASRIARKEFPDLLIECSEPSNLADLTLLQI